MAINETFIQVAPDSNGKKVDNTQVTTAAGDVLRQQIGLTDPEDAAARARVTNAPPAANAYGIAVRPVEDVFDTGMVSVPAVLGAVTPDTIKVDVILLVNLKDVIHEVTVTNTNGDIYVPAVQLSARQVLPIPMYGIAMVGIKWDADEADSVNAQIRGKR